MGNLGPGEKPKVVRKRAARAQRSKPKPPAAAIPGLGPVARPIRPARVPPKPTARARRAQRQTEHAQPLSPTPVKPTNVDAPKPKLVARPLQAKPPKGIKAGKPVTDSKQVRGVTIAAYDQLSGAGKRGHLAGAAKRYKQDKATNADLTILHAHESRVGQKQKVAKAQQAYDLLAGEQIGGADKKGGLHYQPGTVRLGGRTISSKGEDLGPAVTADMVKKQGSVANLPSVGKVAATLGPIATKGLANAGVPKIIANIPKDAGELAVTSPTAVVKSISTAVSHPKQEAEALVGEYGKLAKHPKEFITNKPVTAALMLNPLARAPGLVTGKVLRTAGKQTLRRGVATLPGTALREELTGSRAAGRRVVQSVKDKRAVAKGKEPQVTAHQLDQRVDEAFAGAQHHAIRVRSSMGKITKTVAKEHPKGSPERADVLESGRLAAKGAVKHQTQRSFAKEFGATARVENGRIIEHPTAIEGHLHANVEDARAVAEHLNAKAPTIKQGHGNLLSGDPLGRLYAHKDVPVKFVVRKVGETKHAVVPEQAAQRLAHHQSVGSTQARGAKVLRTSRTMFTRAVLPYRPSWLSGQGIEGAVKSAVKQAGPTSYLRAKRYVNALERQKPGSGKAYLDRASPSGIIGSHQIETPNRTLREEFPGSNVARALTDIGRQPGIKQVRDLNRHVTDFVFNKVNAKALEGVPQTAMLGKVLKDSPLMERKLVGLTNKAMDEAAKGGVRPETAAATYRELQKSYGKYEGYSPHMRELISHWTPFLPWYLSTARFLLSTLPKSHPFTTALIADMDSATEDWRKQQGLSFRDKTHQVPGFMLGGYPVKGSSIVGKALGLKKDETHILRIGHYTPAGIGSDVLGAVSGLPLPQFSGAYNAALGLDWKNQPLKHEDGRPFTDSEKFVYGLTQLAEAMVPLSGQVAGVTGVPGMEPPAKDKGEALKKLVRPISTVERKKTPGGTQVTPVKVKPVKLKPIKVKPVQAGG